MRNRRRGIFFVSVLLTTLLLAMLVGAALSSGVWGMKQGANQSDVAAARRAAQGGVEYALARLRDNPQWKADSARVTTVSEPGFFVVEERGNVVGIMDCGGQISQFRIRFNYNDGAGGADGMNDPSSAMNIPSGLVSFNNMLSNSTGEVPRADGPGHSVQTAPVTYTSVPGHSVFLVVEGRCGDWLEAATPNNPNPPAPLLGSTSLSQVETVYKVSNAANGGTPAVGASAGNFKATVGTGNRDDLTLDSASGSVVGRLRSRADMEVEGGRSGDYNLTSGRGGGEYRVQGASSVRADPSVVNRPEGASDSLYQIPWSEVHKADGSNLLPAGTYVVWDDGSLHYFDMSLRDYRAFMAIPANHGNAGQTVNLPSTMSLHSSSSGSSLKARITVTGDTLVQAATNTTDLAIIPQKAMSSGPGPVSGPASSISLLSPSTTDMYESIQNGTSMILNWNPTVGTFTVPDPAGYNFLRSVGQWSDSQGFGQFYPASGGWHFSGGSMDDLGNAGAHGTLDAVGMTNLTNRIQAYVAAHPADPNWPDFAQAMSSGGGSSQDEIPGVTSQATPQNLELRFNPPRGGAATLTAPGNVTLGTKLTGEGASITSEGNLNLIGLGVDLSALSDPTQGVSLYSKKNVTISTYDKAEDKYHDVALKGVVYTWGNFQALLGATGVAESKWGKLKLTGAMIAYGKDPSDLSGPTSGGSIEMLAKDVKLKYDPAYLLDLSNTLPANITMLRVRWSEQ